MMENDRVRCASEYCRAETTRASYFDPMFEVIHQSTVSFCGLEGKPLINFENSVPEWGNCRRTERPGSVLHSKLEEKIV
jgi:hypothetical protein